MWKFFFSILQRALLAAAGASAGGREGVEVVCRGGKGNYGDEKKTTAGYPEVVFSGVAGCLGATLAACSRITWTASGRFAGGRITLLVPAAALEGES